MADLKFSGLLEIADITGNDVVPVSQDNGVGGYDSRKWKPGTAANHPEADFEPAGSITAHEADLDPHSQYTSAAEAAAAAPVQSVDGKSGAVDLSADYEPRRLHNLTATTDPVLTDDSSLGYTELSRWVNTVTGEIFVCIDSSVGAADWPLASLTLDDLGSAATSEIADFTPASHVGSTTGHPVATITDPGLLSAADKVKINGIEPEAKDDQSAAEVPFDPTGTRFTATQLQALGAEIDTSLREHAEDVAAATVNIDRADGGIQTLTLTVASTLTITLAEGQSLTLHLSGGATYAVTWPTTTWVGGSAPTLTAADVIEFWKVGTTLYGAYVGGV